MKLSVVDAPRGEPVFTATLTLTKFEGEVLRAVLFAAEGSQPRGWFRSKLGAMYYQLLEVFPGTGRVVGGGESNDWHPHCKVEEEPK